MLSARRARVFLLSPPSRLGSVVLLFLLAIREKEMQNRQMRLVDKIRPVLFRLFVA